MANFTRKQGEVWRTTIEMFDSNNCAILLASVGAAGPTNHQAFFQGTATKTLVSNGLVVNVPIRFKLKPAETIESGRGSNRETEFGYFKLEAFIPSDIDQSPLTPLTPLSTIDMEVGDWKYAIRYSDALNPKDDDNVRVIIEGTITIEARIVDLLSTNVANSIYTTPTE